MKRLIAIVMLSMTLVGTVFARDKWQVGEYRELVNRDQLKQTAKALGDGYHISIGTENYTCIGGDESNAPYCGKDSEWYEIANSRRVASFADSTAYGCDLYKTCPFWVQELAPAMYSVGQLVSTTPGERIYRFLYRVDKKGDVEIKGYSLKISGIVLDGKAHNLVKQ